MVSLLAVFGSGGLSHCRNCLHPDNIVRESRENLQCLGATIISILSMEQSPRPFIHVRFTSKAIESYIRLQNHPCSEDRLDPGLAAMSLPIVRILEKH